MSKKYNRIMLSKAGCYAGQCKRKLINIYILLLFLAVGCANSANNSADFCVKVYSPEYASGFEILGADGRKSTILKVYSPWQGADNETKTLFIRRQNETVPADFKGTVVDENASRIICMSSSHVAMLSAIDADSLVVGVSGKKFIYSNTLDRAKDVGYDEYTDYEMIISLNPDIVFIYGVSGASPMEKKLSELDIPFAYIGEYLEDSPLGKAEWLVAVSEIVGRRNLGDFVFEGIAHRYNSVKASINSSSNVDVMLNTPYGDLWFMPGNKSYMIRLIEDAGGNYIYKKNDSNRSMPIDIEEAVALTSKADVWLNAEAGSISDLCSRCHNCADAPAILTNRVYNCDKRKNHGGGNDFWESGVVNPDIILKDLAAIFKNESTDSLYYYRKLQ